MARCGHRKGVVLLRSVDGPVAGQDRYTELMQETGFEVHNVPTLAFQYHDLDMLKEQLDSPSSFSGIIFTSPRAVFAVKEAMADQHLHSGWSDKPCFVVGDRTDALVQQHLGLSGVGADSGNAAALADTISMQMEGGCKPLLFPCGNLKKETLPTKLCNAGIHVSCCTVYSTCQHPDMIAELKKCMELEPDFIVYFSPSGVNFSAEHLSQDGQKQVKHVAIGPSTRDALIKNGFQVFGSASKPCPESVIQVLQGS